MGCGGSKATQVNAVGNDATGSSSKDKGSSKSKASSKSQVVPPDIIAKKCSQAASTRVLTLRECGLKTLPPAAVGDGQAVVRTADLAVNLLKALPESIGNWQGLQNLLCADNALEKLPAAIGKLGNLQKMVLSQNQLCALPSELADLGKIKVLTLDSNKLGPQLSDVFAGAIAEALEELDLSNNALKDLPPSISGLRALTRLIVSKNELRTLPDTFGTLTKLQHLDAADNVITSIPVSLFEAPSLSELWLKGNPLDRLKLQQTPGFDKFLERRKQRLDSKIDSNVVGAIDLSVCGLE